MEKLITEKCGVIGIIDLSGKEVVKRAVQMLNSLQHRGDDSAGIITVNYGFHRHRGLGFVSQIFTQELLERYELGGSLAVGHTRYLNQGAKGLEFSQPLIASNGKNVLALAHNGNDNDSVLKEKLARMGIKPQPAFDSNFLVHGIVHSHGQNWIEKIQNGLLGIRGSYSLVMATNDGHLLAVRDPWANRPISMARIKGGFVFASETVAFPVVKGYEKYELKPGEIIDISKDGIFRSALLEEAVRGGRCVFEKIYLAHETSELDGETVATFRKRLGVMLAQKHRGTGEVVTSVPESANAAARAYAFASGKPLEGLIIKKRLSIKRSFMQNELGGRKQEVETKFDYSPDARGRKIDKIDDSKILGNTDLTTNKILRDEIGAEEIHDRSTAPPIYRDCPWGVNFRSGSIDSKTKKEGSFVALDPEGNLRSYEEIARELGSTTIDYVSLDELKEVADMGKIPSGEYCYYCVGGEGLSETTLKKERPAIEPFFKLITLD